MDIKEVLETVFIPEWSTHAYICKGGEVWIQLQMGKCFLRRKFLIDPLSDMDQNGSYKKRVLELFDELDEYYKTKYRKIKPTIIDFKSEDSLE
jgi:hypothetical protein